MHTQMVDTRPFSHVGRGLGTRLVDRGVVSISFDIEIQNEYLYYDILNVYTFSKMHQT